MRLPHHLQLRPWANSATNGHGVSPGHWDLLPLPARRHRPPSGRVGPWQAAVDAPGVDEIGSMVHHGHRDEPWMLDASGGHRHGP